MAVKFNKSFPKILKGVRVYTTFEEALVEWLTTQGNVFSGNVGDTILIEFEADGQGGSEVVSYTVVQGQVPPGTILNDTGDMFGVAYIEDANGPDWQTATANFEYDEFDVASLQFTVTPNSGTAAPIEDFMIVAGNIPWGLTLNTSGLLSGTIENMVPSPTGVDSKKPVPTWSTAEGTLGTFEEFESVAVSVSATPNLGSSLLYSVVSGYLPWGLSLNSDTGGVTGTTENIVPGGTTFTTPQPDVTWNTTSTIIADVDEGVAMTPVTLSATANKGTTIDSYELVSGYIPWGLVLNFETGQISGTPSEIVPTTLPHVSREPDPVWVTSSGSLGSADEGTVISTTVEATPQAGRSLEGYQLVAGYMPWGLVLDVNTGAITGTLTDVDSTTVYNFTIRAIDDSYGYDDRAFSYTVNNV